MCHSPVACRHGKRIGRRPR
uniref:Uncharacterized protein n=1 Tax=Rhizophora mucronata TaxID=61149 RepID=A0A2P2QYK7_RHIMU